MKTAKLGDYFLWNGEFVKVVAINEGHKSITFQSLQKQCCPHCKAPINFRQFDVIESSPLFQEGATPIQTITRE